MLRNFVAHVVVFPLGWYDLDHGDSSKGEAFLDDDVWIRRVLGTVSIGQFRRKGKLYTDCFTAAEVVDCLLDHEIVESFPLAVIMGQELVFQKRLIPVFIAAHDEVHSDEFSFSDEISPRNHILMSPRKKDIREVNRAYASMISSSSHSDEFNVNRFVEFSSKDNLSTKSVLTSNSGEDEFPLRTASDDMDAPVGGERQFTTPLTSNSGEGGFPLRTANDVMDVCVDDERPLTPTRRISRHVAFFFDDIRSTISSRLSNDASLVSKLAQSDLVESFSSPRKLTSTMDTHFMDDNSLYRLNLQGEQVTEWLMNSKNSEKELKELKKQRRENEKQTILEGYSFGLFGRHNPLRVFCTNLITHKYFEYIVLLVIIASSVCLAIDEPGVDTASSKALFLKIADYCFTVFFIVEMLVKMVARRAFGTRGSYFASGWNLLDFFIVFTSVISLALVSLDLSYLKVFRALRSLRPLRMVSRSPSLKAVVNAIIMVATPLANFTLVISVFLLTFAILGTTIFRDKLQYCKASSLDITVPSVNDAEFEYMLDKSSCVGNVTNIDGVLVGLQWSTRNSNFDSVSRSLLTLFELITMEAWPTIMHPAMDIPNHGDEHPIENNSKYNALFFIIFIVVGAFFITNLFVGIIVYKFRSAREKHHGSALLTYAQQKWLDDIQVAMTAKPLRHATLPDENALLGLKRPIHLLVINEKFMFGMDMIIIVNILIMSLEHFNQGRVIDDFIVIANNVFTAIFTIEIVLRFLAVRPKEFVAGKWNRLDSLIVILALIDTIGGVIAVNVTIFRVFRVARLFRLIKDSRNLIILIKTLYFSLPSLINVATLLFLSFFVFAIVAMNLFGEAKRDDNLFNEYANFEGFLSSLLLLFQCMTGEDWNSVMYNLKNQGYNVAVPFFALFLLTNKYMLLNLFIAIILENFEAALQADPEKVAQRNLEDFIREWSNIRKEIGSDDDDSMPSYCLVKILHSLEPPLGIRGTREANLALRTAEDRQRYRRYLLSLIRSLDLKEDSSGRVFFVDVVSALVRRQHATEDGENVSVVENMSLDQRHELMSQLRHLTRKKRMTNLEKKMKDKVFTEIDLAVEINSAMYIQAIWRGNMNRKIFQEEILCDMLKDNKKSPRIVLNRTDSNKLRAVLEQEGDKESGVIKALRILKLGSQSFNFVQKQAVVNPDGSSSDSESDSEEEYAGKFYRPRVARREPLEVMSPPATKAKPKNFFKKARSVSVDIKNSALQPFSNLMGGKSSPFPLERRRSSSGLDKIASSSDDFNYFTVFEDADRRIVLTHVNSQRHLMENLFDSQQKKKSFKRQSTRNLQVDIDDDFKDLDVYVLRPKNGDDDDASTNDGDFHL